MSQNSNRQTGSPSKRYRVVVLGEGGVGKSALTLQYVQRSFLEHHDPTIEDAYVQRTVIEGEPCLLDILDTAGQVEFTAMREQYMRGGEGFMICYSIADRHSFKEVEQYINLITKVRPAEDVPVVIVGNKVDLEVAGLREVSTTEGKELASKLSASFLEASAAERWQVDDIFCQLVRDIKKSKEGHYEIIEKIRPSGSWKRVWSRIKKSNRKFKHKF